MSLNKFFTKATHPETQNHLWQTKLLPWSQCPPPGRQSAWVQSWTCWRKCRSVSQISQMIPHVIHPIHAKKNRNYKDQRSVKRGKRGLHSQEKPTNWDQHDRNAVFAARIFSCPVRLDFSFICSGCAWKRDEKSVGQWGCPPFLFGKWWSTTWVWGWKFQDKIVVKLIWRSWNLHPNLLRMPRN